MTILKIHTFLFCRHYNRTYGTAGKFGGENILLVNLFFSSIWQKFGFSLTNYRWFTTFTKLSPHKTFPTIQYIFAYLWWWMCSSICDWPWENRSYLHKIHMFVLWYLYPVLCVLSKICYFHWIPHGFLHMQWHCRYNTDYR